jgi:hypothetical protein
MERRLLVAPESVTARAGVIGARHRVLDVCGRGPIFAQVLAGLSASSLVSWRATALTAAAAVRMGLRTVRCTLTSGGCRVAGQRIVSRRVVSNKIGCCKL